MKQFNTRTALFLVGATISLGFATLIALFFESSMTTLLKERETEHIKRYQAQTHDILYREGESLSLSLREWASKAAMYDFIDTHDTADGIGKRMQTNPIFLMRLNYIAVVANDGFVSERFFDYRKKTELDDAPHVSDIVTVSRWLHRETQSAYAPIGPNGDVFGTLSRTQRSGFVGIGDHVFHFAAAPVLTPDNDRASNGTLVFGRMISADELRPALLPRDEGAGSVNTTLSVCTAQAANECEPGVVRYTPCGAGIVLESFIPTIDDSIIVLSTELQRTAFFQSAAAVKTLSILVFGISCLISFVLLCAVELWLVRPIATLAGKVSQLKHEQLQAALPVFRGRELNTLVTAIGDLLRRIGDHKNHIEEQNNTLCIQNQMLHRLANYDAHTNLPNKNMLATLVEQRICAAKERGGLVGLMYIDITNFSLIVDACGQSTCDMMLTALAERLTSAFCGHGENAVARSGRENFALVVSAEARSEIEDAAHALLAAFEEPLAVEDHEIAVNAAIGISISPNDGDTFEELGACASIAMNNASESDKTAPNLVFFEHRQLERVIAKYNRIAELKRGMDRGEFRVVFQPKVDVRTNRITSAEALVRWNAPSGQIPPSHFIPDACETGLIVPLSWEIMRQAFEGTNRLAAELGTDFSIGVNVPNNVLLHSDFLPVLTGLLDETRMPPSWLNVELTEDVLVNDVEKCNARMLELQRMGAEISIDDFGTGYASLQYLSKMPFDWMKIDKAFVDGLPNKQEDMAIIAASVGIARALGMKVVLEGVETMRQWEMIAEQRYCDQIQGYVVSKPLPEDDFISFVASWNAQTGRQVKLTG